MNAVKLSEDAANFVARKDDREAPRPRRTLDLAEPRQLASEDLAVKEEQGGKRLVMGGGGDVTLVREVIQERLDLRRAQFVRVPPPVEMNEASHPGDVSLLRSIAVVAIANGLANPVEQAWWRGLPAVAGRLAGGRLVGLRSDPVVALVHTRASPMRRRFCVLVYILAVDALRLCGVAYPHTNHPFDLHLGVKVRVSIRWSMINLMQLTTGIVVGGKVVVEGDPLPEGTVVTILARDADETFEVPPELEAELLESIAQADRGETVSADEVIERLRRIT